MQNLKKKRRVNWFHTHVRQLQKRSHHVPPILRHMEPGQVRNPRCHTPHTPSPQAAEGLKVFFLDICKVTYSLVELETPKIQSSLT